MEEAPDSLVGSRLAGYVLREHLGSGGSATVYSAESTTHASIVRAIKVIRKSQRSRFGKRFTEEARLLEKLVHPNIVRFYHATEDKGNLVMALELLEGSTLRKQLDAWRVKGELPPLHTIVDIMCGAAEGVAFAHTFVEVVVHRDLKPDNLFVTNEGATKVLDFGIARALDDAEREDITTTGATAIGTAAYLPPELWGGNELPTPASDVYSLGITLFEAVAGRHPFQELGNPKKNQAAYMKAHLMDEVKPLRQVRPDVPESLEDVVTRATAKEPKVRYANAKEFGEALRAVRHELASLKDRPPVRAVQPSEPMGEGIKTTVPLPQAPKSVLPLPEIFVPEERNSFPRLLVAYGLGAIALGVGIAVMLWLTKPKKEEQPPPTPSASSSMAAPVLSASAIPTKIDK